MAITAVHSCDQISADSIPVIDLRFLSQSDLDSLVLCSSAARRGSGDLAVCPLSDDLVIPKIDRSVFNESAGSRKQTYSRLRIAARPPSESSSTVARHRRRILPGPQPLSSDPADMDSDKSENKRIVQSLRDLFDRENPGLIPAAAEDAGRKAMMVFESRNGDQIGSAHVSRDENVEVLNKRGVVVDLAALGTNIDLYGEELRRRTSGMETEAELLEFLRGLKGSWGSRRKKRKIVDAEEFGDDLPRGWKVILGIRRKEGRVFLYCRRFISPAGQQFVSCKEVSSYLQPFIGSKDARQSTQIGETSHFSPELPVTNTSSVATEVGITREVPIHYAAMPISSIVANPSQQVVLFRVENPAKAQLRNLLECRKCNLSFGDKDAYVQHLFSVHHRNAKRSRLGKSVGDGVIMRDGKYECQFCHKVFDERRRYNGHVGIHVRNYGKSLEEIPDEIIVRTSIDPSILAVMPQIVMPQIVPEMTSDVHSGSVSVQGTSTFMPITVISSHNKQEIHSSTAAKSSEQNLLENSQGLPVKHKSVDVDPNLSLSATPSPTADKENHHEKTENKPEIEVTNDTMDVDLDPGLKKLSPSKMEGLDECMSTNMDVDSNLILNNLNNTFLSEEEIGNAAGSNLGRFFEVINKPMDMDPTLTRSYINMPPLPMNVENITYEGFPAKDGNELIKGSDRNGPLSHKEESEGIEAYGKEVEREDLVLDGPERPGNKIPNSLESSSMDEGRGVFETELHVGDTLHSKLEEHVINDTRDSVVNMGIDLGSIYNTGSDRADITVPDVIGNVSEKNLMKRKVTDTGSLFLQRSDFLPAIDVRNKEECEFTTVGQRPDSSVGFEELRLEDIEATKFDFLTGRDSRSLPQATIDLACGPGLEEALHSSVQFQWDTDLPRMDGPEQLTTLCIWCRVEFNQEVTNSEMQSDSVGFICPTCKAKISGQLNILDNGLSL